MKLKKPNFWDYKKPTFISFLLLPFTFPFIINNFFLDRKDKTRKNSKIKSICVGNIYVGGTTKTPLTIRIDKILKKIDFKTATIKKFYNDQLDEQKLLQNKTTLYCYTSRKKAIEQAIKDKIDIAIFDDGLQELSLNYDLSFVCFNSSTWIGNGLLMPAGPLREKISSIKKYDAIFLNGNGEDNSRLKLLIKKINQNINIFETTYTPINLTKPDDKEKYLIFSGIGNPKNFKMTLLKNNFNVIKEITYADHHQYKLKQINKIKKIAKNLNAKIITTEKDYIKLNSKWTEGIECLKVELTIKDEDKLINLIKNII